MTLDAAKAKARRESRHGYVQHVNRASWTLRAYPPADRSKDGDDYIVSDWCDASTVASFYKGKELHD